MTTNSDDPRFPPEPSGRRGAPPAGGRRYGGPPPGEQYGGPPPGEQYGGTPPGEQYGGPPPGEPYTLPYGQPAPGPDGGRGGGHDRGAERSSVAGVARRSATKASRAAWRGMENAFGGPARTRVIVMLACALALGSADTATVGASATELRQALHIGNTDIGLLVSVTALVGAIASVPFGILVDRFNRVGLMVGSMVLWGVAMLASASVSSFGALLVMRLFLGGVTAVAGPAVASLVGDYFPSAERGKIYGYILGGELVGGGVGFFVTGDVAALSWRAAFVVLALPAFALAWWLRTLREPARGGGSRLEPGATQLVGRKEAGLTPSAVTDEELAAEPPPEITEAQQLARERGIRADPRLVLRQDPRRMNIIAVFRYVVQVRTNVVIIVSSACGYFFLTGVQTFGLEFASDQYHVHTIVANLLMLVVGVGAVVGVLCGGPMSDMLLRKRYLKSRVLVPGIAALLGVALFIPAFTTTGVLTALPYITLGAFCLTAQNPPLDAARLDIMPPLLWGRAEGIRTFLRAAAQAIAPLTFGGLSSLLGDDHESLRITFLIMLVPMAVSGIILLRGMRHYPVDVATAAESTTYMPNAPSVPLAPRRRTGRRREDRRYERSRAKGDDQGLGRIRRSGEGGPG